MGALLRDSWSGRDLLLVAQITATGRQDQKIRPTATRVKGGPYARARVEKGQRVMAGTVGIWTTGRKEGTFWKKS